MTVKAITQADIDTLDKEGKVTWIDPENIPVWTMEEFKKMVGKD